LDTLEWLGMEEVGFGLTGMALNKGSKIWSDWNCFKWRNLVLVLAGI
jgi:hypothetical protein